MDGLDLLGLAVALVVGALVGWLVAERRSVVRTTEAVATHQVMADRLADAQRSYDELLEQLVRDRAQERELTALVAPLRETLGKVEGQLSAAERDRAIGQAALREQVDAVRRSSDEVRREAATLSTALRAPQVRGRWGERQLERIIEAAGMVEHCDFVRQPQSTTDDGTLRPDLVVRLSGGRQVVVDAKVPFAGYLAAVEAPDERTQVDRLAAHARHVRDHVTRLAAKAYWERFEPSPDFVVMFVPSDAFLSAALERDPALLEHAFDRDVVIATPSTLLALLRTVAYSWRQDEIAENAREVLTLGRELHSRLSTMGNHLGQLGRELRSAVEAYNHTVGSLETRVLVTARRFADLQSMPEGPAAPAGVVELPRPLTSPELLDSQTEPVTLVPRRATR